MHYGSFQTNRIARFGAGGAFMRSAEPMTDEQIRAVAPSVFAEGKHDSRSDKFTYLPTIDTLRGLRREAGYEVFEVRQGGSKDAEKRGFTKHLVRLRRPDEGAGRDSKRELVLLNAHDGTSSYRLLSGVFRVLCSNGLVVCDGEAQELRIPHKGDVVGDVIEGAYRIVQDGDRIDAAIADMKAIDLTPNEQGVFAAAAAELRFEEGKVPDGIAQRINRPRRSEDTGADIWTTFNRAQENLIRGNVPYVHTNAEGVRTHRTTRPVNSVDSNVNLNRALWTLAQGMERLKQGEPAASVIANVPMFG